MKPRVFSGVQPSGDLHIGNYLGALKNWTRIQDDYECIYCIVDLHAITVYQEPEKLQENIRRLAGQFLAAGIDPAKSAVIVQSSIPAHAELAWMLTCVTPVGWLERMTQYKDKSVKQKTIGDGLLQYPVLMAADILLYQAQVVPVGEDQTQHLELTRDIAQSFNSRYGETFKMPETKLPAVGARVMGLDDPETKMAKSATGANHAIFLLDPPDATRKKIMRAKTDTQPAVEFKTIGPGIRNLLNIFQAFTDWTDDQIQSHFEGMRYGDIKKEVAGAVIAGLEPIQRKYHEITADSGYIDQVLREAAARVAPVANSTVELVKKRMGLYV